MKEVVVVAATQEDEDVDEGENKCMELVERNVKRNRNEVGKGTEKRLIFDFKI